jgi:uncharacterized protein (TIGR00661 family)
MKIFYAVQATGNGHISRAVELLPYLQQYGQVDVFLSGENCHLPTTLPVKFKSKGVSLFYGNRGGLNYFKMWQKFSLARIWREAKSLPVEAYDIVINDFECITSLACKFKNKPSIQFGHQASFRSPLSPRPKKREFIGEWILKNYATATSYFGLHFNAYDIGIYNPVIKADILAATPINKGHVTVYLSHYSKKVITQQLHKAPGIRFEVFTKEVKSETIENNIRFMPISNEGFTKSMIESAGVITGAGFETPAEALYLGKKLICLPIRGQYEQLCNAAALEQLGVPVVKKIHPTFFVDIAKWYDLPAPTPLKLEHSTYQLVQKVIEQAKALNPAQENNVANENLNSFAV